MARRSTKHTSMSKRYSNPEQFVSEMVELASQSPQDAAEVAATWRERFHNVTESTGEMIKGGAGLALTAATAFAMSMWEGANEAAAEDMADKWLATPEASAAAIEAGVDLAAMSDYDRERFAFDKMEETDPRKLWFIGFGDKVWATTILFSIVYGFNLAGEAVSPWFGKAAVGGIAAGVSSIGYRLGKDAKERSLATALTE